MHCKVIVGFILNTQLRDALSAKHAMFVVVSYRSAFPGKLRCDHSMIMKLIVINRRNGEVAGYTFIK